jgi:hypothetical protein
VADLEVPVAELVIVVDRGNPPPRRLVLVLVRLVALDLQD